MVAATAPRRRAVGGLHRHARIGLAFPVLPRLIEEFEGGSVSRASYIYGALAGRRTR